MGDFDFNNIDKSKWKKYRFDQIAKSIGERVEPQQTDLEVYVGLEHIDSDSVHIKRTGVPSDVEGTKLRVYPGDVIFGKRRAYQRKAAIATFDGICSAHAMVLRAVESVIDPKLFPFFLHSDYFMDRAIDISVGSLSPTINWGTLKTQEFLLPPKGQQAKLAELLWAADEVVQQYDNLKRSQIETLSSFFDVVYKEKSLKYLPLGECLEFSQYGISEQLNDVGDIPVLRMNNLQNKKVVMDDLKYIMRSTFKNSKSLSLKKGDILFNRTNSYELVGKVGLFDLEKEVTFASYLIRLRVNDDIVLPEYLNSYLNSEKGQAAIRVHRTPGVSQSNINVENLKKIAIPIVSKNVQLELIKKIALLESAMQETEAAIKSVLTIQKQLINQIFSA